MNIITIIDDKWYWFKIRVSFEWMMFKLRLKIWKTCRRGRHAKMIRESITFDKVVKNNKIMRRCIKYKKCPDCGLLAFKTKRDKTEYKNAHIVMDKAIAQMIKEQSNKRS